MSNQLKIRHPYLCLFLSLMVPGMVHIYYGSMLRGSFLLVLYGLSWLFIPQELGISLAFVVMITAAVSAFRAACKYNACKRKDASFVVS